MGSAHESISPQLQAFIEAQRIFFVASAPAGAGGHVNLSPKGMDTFRVLGPRSVAYLDLTGSGNETAAHVKENGRISLMFCAFEGKPMVLRLYGKGSVVRAGAERWEALSALFPAMVGVRQVITVELTRVQTSCGYGVPVMKFDQERDALRRWAESKGEQGLRKYREEKNRLSIDGLDAE